MLSVREAQTKILDLVRPLKEFDVAELERAAGRILACPVASQLDFPQDDNSAMDGYAVRAADASDCSPQHPAYLKIVEEIPAGTAPQRSLQPGQAARIFTGGILPAGADAIVIQENTRREGDRLSVLQPVSVGTFVRQKASFYRAGSPLLSPGIALGAAEIALLAAAQCTRVEVLRRPRVAILSTGDELVPPDRPLQRGQIVDSNQYALATLVAENGGLPLPLGIVRDRREELRAKMETAIASADFVLSTGGVSVGEYDFVEELLAELGGEIAVRSVAIKPGKPLTVANFTDCLYFGIPGNPVSTLVSFWRFVLPAMRKLSGLASGWQPLFWSAQTRQELRAGGTRETYLWGHLSRGAIGCEFSLAAGSHSSGNLVNIAGTNALAIVPVGTTAIAAGETVEVMAIGLPYS